MCDSCAQDSERGAVLGPASGWRITSQAPACVEFLDKRGSGSIRWHVAGKDRYHMHVLPGAYELRDLSATRKHGVVEVGGEINVHGLWKGEWQNDDERLTCHWHELVRRIDAGCSSVPQGNTLSVRLAEQGCADQRQVETYWRHQQGNDETQNHSHISQT